MAKGISNETRGTSLKKFKPDPNKYNGLCIGALDDVVVGDAEIKEDSSMEFFAGHVIPRISFHFSSRKDLKGVKPSHYTHSYLAIEHTPESLSEDKDTGTAWKWRNMAQMIKHFLDVYRDDKELSAEEVAMLQVDFEDERDGLFLEQPTEVVIEAYRKFFENIVALFKPEGKAIYKDANGKDITIWMKLLLDIKGSAVNKGDYGFPGYPGEGVIEKYVEGVPPSISIKVEKGENIVPKAITPAAPRPTRTPNGEGASMTGGGDIPSFMG